jgi:hypothetical protein
MLQASPRDAQHLRALVESGDMAGMGAEQLGHAPRAGADIQHRAQIAVLQQSALQRRLHRGIVGHQPAQFVPLHGVALEIGGRAAFAPGADRGQMAPVLGAARGESGIVMLGSGQQAGGGPAQRRRGKIAILGNGAFQKDPTALLAPLGKPRIAEDFDMARHTRLALPQHLRQFTHSQLHRRKQAHDAQPRGVCQRAEDRVDLHGGVGSRPLV